MLLASAASAAAILGGWQLGQVETASLDASGTVETVSSDDSEATDAAGTTDPGQDASGSTGSSDSGATDPGATGAGSSGSAGTGTASSGAADGTYSGSSVSTRFGDVQVQVTVSGGAITEVTALRLTDHDGRSVQISNRAEPVLRDEVLQAQSARVSFVSGATYTSAAYLQSLQSALDQAGFTG
ncbi:Uncharacterized protein, contains FMN-binding domain [Agromyces sp. CF514]|nr:Uncharacterized protein, contains FMN-binding domain [Agromyces sp. CF514]